MMHEWEGTDQLGRERAMDLCYQWVKKCDALYFIAPSAGADRERELAKQNNIPIYRNLEDIPDASPASVQSLSREAREGYLVEYHECIDSYRHTYTTIWQAGAIFAAISGRPRVKEVVTIFGVAILLLELALVWKNYSHIKALFLNP